MRYVLMPALPLLIGMVGLAMLMSLVTAMTYLAAFSVFAFLGYRYYDKHHASERYDSKLTDERMAVARDRWIAGGVERRKRKY